MYKLCVFAGTTEGRALVELLAGQPVAVTACVATEYGGALLEPRENLTVSRERLTREEMEELFTREGFALVVDATHPYAAAVTENIAAACEGTGTEYLRLLRSAGDVPEGAVCVPDIRALETALHIKNSSIWYQDLPEYAAEHWFFICAVIRSALWQDMQQCFRQA